MNILYLYHNSIDPKRGGIQRVTSVLAEYFQSQGSKVFFLSAHKNGNENESHLQYYLPNKTEILCSENILFLKRVIQEWEIDILINQNGMDPIMSKLSYHAKHVDCRLVSCIHNSLLSQISHFSVTYSQSAKNIGLRWLLPITDTTPVKNMLLFLYKLKYSQHYKNICDKSDKVVLLSHNFNSELDFFLPKTYLKKNIHAIANPVSFAFLPENRNKKKQLLYVGRIDRRQKRVDLLLSIWERLHTELSEWSLVIVGGGRDLEKLKVLAKLKNLQNITFTGFDNPQNYYLDSSIFCLTSSYEGFGIVLVEAMAYGTVPFAFNSYASAKDIIDDGVNGKLITPFDIDEYADQIKKIVYNSNTLEVMSNNARIKSRDFDLENVGKKWLNLFESLNCK